MSNKEQSAEIKRIVLNLGGKEVSLTIEQAKKLKEILSEMFGKDVVKEIYHHDHYPHWYWHWSAPAFTYGSNSTAKGPETEILYKASNGSLSVNL